MADTFTQGMQHYTAEQSDLTPELDRFQFSLFRRFLGDKVLEVGGGGGRLTELVAAHASPREFVCIEPSPHFFEILRKRYAESTAIQLLNCTTTDIQDQYPARFDTVFSVHVMEHIDDDRAFIEQCLALTRPGGVVVVLVPALQFLYSDLDRNIGHYRRYSKKTLRELVSGLDARLELLQYNNLLGVLASAYFIKFRKLDYQKSPESRASFFRLYSAYSKWVVPLVNALEGIVPPPLGLNLTLALRKGGAATAA